MGNGGVRFGLGKGECRGAYGGRGMRSAARGRVLGGQTGGNQPLRAQLAWGHTNSRSECVTVTDDRGELTIEKHKRLKKGGRGAREFPWLKGPAYFYPDVHFRVCEGACQTPNVRAASSPPP